MFTSGGTNQQTLTGERGKKLYVLFRLGTFYFSPRATLRNLCLFLDIDSISLCLKNVFSYIPGKNEKNVQYFFGENKLCLSALRWIYSSSRLSRKKSQFTQLSASFSCTFFFSHVPMPKPMPWSVHVATFSLVSKCNGTAKTSKAGEERALLLCFIDSPDHVLKPKAESYPTYSWKGIEGKSFFFCHDTERKKVSCLTALGH